MKGSFLSLTSCALQPQQKLDEGKKRVCREEREDCNAKSAQQQQQLCLITMDEMDFGTMFTDECCVRN